MNKIFCEKVDDCLGWFLPTDIQCKVRCVCGCAWEDVCESARVCKGGACEDVSVKVHV